MKVLLVFLTFTILGFASRSNGFRSSRRYVPNENDPYRFKEIAFEDDIGKLHFENLSVEHLQERSITPGDVTLHLFTRKHPKTSVAVPINKAGDLLRHNQSFNASALNYFIIHGWRNNYKSNVNVVITEAILNNYDVNVFVVDWSTYAFKFYTTSKAAVPQIGLFLANFISDLLKEYQIPHTQFVLVGHSLGAHIAGCTGSALSGQIDHIIGLDPAGPLFSLNQLDNRLDETDAKFVQVVHTNGYLLGFSSAIGHADYYPNDGNRQPGCGIDLFGKCAHSRAYYYYAESIWQGGFEAEKCLTYDEFMNSNCITHKKSFLGTFFIDKSAYGDYYLDTNREAPFALGTR
ncbi:hypothetical protein PPYR_05323 [Photinus pyralis]|uniref:Lipase domain-containing protein n=2 Tax=Photinus pyralis TaxID=7054 RepID=A0A5N4AUH8_PHOPY|nr:phospholipase A1-like [Photinus pyralis]KAB0800969.1 hypothetical protein PPYR_05323 [Photinus pyralis]